MKTRMIALTAGLAMLLSGCSLWMDGEYVSVKPHTQQGYQQEQGVVAVEDYQQLRSVLEDMVESGTESDVIIVEALDMNRLDSHMQTAIRYVMQNNPIGAYAVNSINYDIGSVKGAAAVSVDIAYNNGRAELRRIRHVEDVSAAKDLIATVLNQCEASVVLLIRDYADTDFAQYVKDYALENPAAVMEIPQVNVGIYPETGNDRVVSLQFVYQSSREALRNMQSYVHPVFSSATLYVSGEGEESVKFAQLFSFLMERNTYTLETSITPAYSLLRHGVGDSRAFATVYASMCRRAGLDCRTVTGTRAGEPWYWNMIAENGVYYHVDLLQSHRSGSFRKMTDGEMSGYVWDYNAYPPCG